MANRAAAEGLFRCIYEGCIPGYNQGVERRPYHRNCGCAFHGKSPKATCTRKAIKGNNVSYPLRRALSEGSLALVASAHSSPSSPAAFGNCRPQRGLTDVDEEEWRITIYRVRVKVLKIIFLDKTRVFLLSLSFSDLIYFVPFLNNWGPAEGLGLVDIL